MTHSKTPLIALAALLVLAGCQKAAPPADSLPAPSQAGATEAAKPAANGVVFTVVPGEVHMCDGRDRVVSEVSWQVADPAVTTVKVEVDTTTDPARKTFTAGGATGSEKTGDWVVQGRPLPPDGRGNRQGTRVAPGRRLALQLIRRKAAMPGTPR